MSEVEAQSAEFREFQTYLASNLRNENPSIDYMTVLQDTPEQVDAAMLQLAEWVTAANHFVVYTGAGASTSAGLPDYRGPNGVWTRRAAGQTWNKLEDIVAQQFLPTFTHRALRSLYDSGTVKHVMTTNVDNLHVASGLERHTALSELHGNLFVEECPNCGEFVRDFVLRDDLRGPHDHATGRRCTQCGAATRDTIVNFGDTHADVPSMEKAYDTAWVHSVKADLFLVLGSSLSVPTACDLPDCCYEKGGRVVIVNQQRTPKDGIASLLIRHPCDDAMRTLVSLLGVAVQ